jgi:UDP-glucuronate 4-epimerase
MKILVTGAAGFIGFHTSKVLLERGDTVVGLDNFNDYYDVALKESRAAVLDDYDKFKMVRINLADRDAMEALFAEEKFDKVVHLAAQAGVRYSIENPHSYIESNIVGTLHILEGCRHNDVKHLTYASSSSIYGANTTMPFSIHQNVDHPLALYGATKKANELMAHTYSNLYALPTTGLRFFTVYGPYGRPDMALFMFTKNIIEGKPIDVFNYGKHRRDFTYILRRILSKASLSTFSTTASTGVTSPTSMTSSKALCARWTTRHSRTRTGILRTRIRARAWRRTASTTSAIHSPWNS